MRRKIIKFRGFEVTKKEIIADLIFFAVSFLITLIILFFFNIHWSFYPGETLFPPSRTMGLSREIYIFGGLTGAVLGFFIIKLFLIGVKEEIKGRRK